MKIQILACVVAGLSFANFAAAQAPDWEAQIRECIAARQLAAALTIVEQRLGQAPQDLEAHGWRARLLAWSGRWTEAEAEYRGVLQNAPGDVDILVGLATVLSWQQRFDEALQILDQAQKLDPKRADIYITQGQNYRALGRIQEAGQAFRKALALNPADKDAKAGLASLIEETRYNLRFGTDIDTFNYTDTAWAYTTSLRARINSQWIANLAGVAQKRFGNEAGRFLSSVTYCFTPRDTLSVGGGVAHDEGVIPKGESFFEYGHGFHLGTHAIFRGMEVNYHQHWFWYQNARVLALTPSLLLYLPREWTWSIQVSAARTHFAGLTAEWHPSGLTRLSFPLYRPLSGNVFYGVGTENFALVDQVGRFSARTFGGGLRYRFAHRQEITGYVLTQDRSQGRSMVSFGFSYALRF